MTKFKVGDKVAFKGNKSYKGVVQKVQPLFGHETIYTIKWNDGKQYDVTEGDLVIANSVRSCNSVVAKALNSVGARNGHNAIRMANSKFKPGDVVYCDYNQQVYAVLGSYDDKVSVRNLLNLEDGSQTVREASLKEYPWKATDKNYPYYEKLAKKFAKR